jgi:hypothetical protein
VGADNTMGLSWDNDAPVGDKITLFARYRPTPKRARIFRAGLSVDRPVSVRTLTTR